MNLKLNINPFSVLLLTLFFSFVLGLDHVVSSHPNGMPMLVKTYNTNNKLELIKETEYYSNGFKSYQKTYYRGELKNIKKWNREGDKVDLRGSAMIDNSSLSIKQSTILGEWVCSETIGEDQKGFGKEAGQGFQMKYIFNKESSFELIYSNNQNKKAYSGKYSFYENIDYKSKPWNCIDDCCNKCKGNKVSGLKFSEGSVKGPEEIFIIILDKNQFLIPDDNREEYYVFNRIK